VPVLTHWGVVTRSGCVALALGLTLSASAAPPAAEADRVEAQLRESGMVLSDPQLSAYLATVADPLLALAPASAPRMRVAILRDPASSAFALPNGAVYVNIGALTVVEDEAQLALLLAQQMNHVALDHSAQIAADARTKTVAAKLTQVALAPLLGLSDVAFAWSMASYAREKQAEAASAAMAWVARAGFETRAAPRLFGMLGEPELQADCDELVASGAVAGHPDGRNDSGALRAAVAGIALETVRLQLALRDYDSARDGARRAIDRYGESAKLRAYEGEALLGNAWVPAELPRHLQSRGRSERDRKEADSRELARLVERARAPLPDAERSFRRALELEPGYGPAQRGLGEVLLRDGDLAGAEVSLSTYLSAHPGALDAPLVAEMLRSIRSASSPAP